MVKSFAKPLPHFIFEKAMCQNFCAIVHHLTAITLHKGLLKNCLQNIRLETNYDYIS